MSMKKKSGFLKLGVFLLISLLIGVGVTRGAWAGLKTEKEYNLYWQNSIFFYDPYECLGGYNDEEEEEEGGGGDPIEWDGNCSDLSSYTERLEKFYPIIKQIAEQHNLPWEGIMAQFIQESSAGKKECASHNPLGLMIKGIKTCRSFNSYEEAFNAYVNSYCAPKAAARNGRFANDPYGYAEFLNGEAGYGCQYNPGDNTYVPLLKSHICSIQKWAQETGKQISGSGSPNPSPSPSSSPSPSPSPSPSSDDDGYTKPNCPGTRKEEEDYDPGSNQEPRDEEEEEKEEEEEEEEEETPDGGDLVDLLKAWVWPDYKGSGFQQRKKAYADYMDNHTGIYKGDCNGVDCGAFVANIMKVSGWDPNYAQGPTGTQYDYLVKNWQKVSADDLQFGDVGITTGAGHVLLYIGNVSGINSEIVSASRCDRAPMADRDNINRYNWFRKK